MLSACLSGSNGCDWSWSGEALAYFPGGDPAGSDDGCPGSLFGTGHNWLQWLSEISIPAPRLSTARQLSELPTAVTLQPFLDIRAGLFAWPLEIPRAGLACLPAQSGQESGKLYFAWAPHMGEGRTDPSHGWSGLDLEIGRKAPACGGRETIGTMSAAIISWRSRLPGPTPTSPAGAWAAAASATAARELRGRHCWRWRPGRPGIRRCRVPPWPPGPCSFTAMPMSPRRGP